MLHTIEDLENFSLHAAGDNIGKVKDFYFADKDWKIYQFILALGSRLSDTKVSISSDSITGINREDKTFSVNISLPQIKNSPQIDTEKSTPNNKISYNNFSSKKINPLHNDLYSCKSMIDYEIQASDGTIGHIKDMLIDEQTWNIRYLVIDTSSWWLGRQVIVAPSWIDKIDWEKNQIIVNLTKKSVKDSPLYDPTIPFNLQYEKQLYLHYGRDGYWEK